MLQGLAFLAPPLLVAAVLMLFLRVFPLILRLATKLAAKKRSASAVLAFAQMERAPRPAARIVILLALAIASSCCKGRRGVLEFVSTLSFSSSGGRDADKGRDARIAQRANRS